MAIWMPLLHSSKKKMLFYSVVVVVVALVTQLSSALRIPMRSVEICDHQTRGHELFTDTRSCQLHCKQNFVNINSKIYHANQDVATFNLRQARGSTQPECCCKVNYPWPQFVAPTSAGLNLRHQKTAHMYDCLPTVFSVHISQRTKESYKTVCKYLRREEPLTILEVIKFAEAASFLNYMKPKHPTIRKTMGRKDIEKIDKEALEELSKPEVMSAFLDSFKSLDEYDGFNLASNRLREIYNLRRYSLKKAIKSPLVAEALDEYIISYAMVDIEAAAIKIEAINLDLQIPEKLLRGHYDKYDKFDKASYFGMHNIDCKLLRQINAKLKVYLSSTRMALESLFEKGVYDHMAGSYDRLISLIQAHKLYNELAEVNCRKS